MHVYYKFHELNYTENSLSRFNSKWILEFKKFLTVLENLFIDYIQQINFVQVDNLTFNLHKRIGDGIIAALCNGIVPLFIWSASARNKDPSSLILPDSL